MGGHQNPAAGSGTTDGLKPCSTNGSGAFPGRSPSLPRSSPTTPPNAFRTTTPSAFALAMLSAGPRSSPPRVVGAKRLEPRPSSTPLLTPIRFAIRDSEVLP
ncbi:hypothetical protein NLX83_37460 [Allokutzneria sp. A3M-2-11 16]|uniref:hypothetical protein n=1 Tax=Allokutzneria sp. A3M-2-11 16 TaxID=2962043 RepID=UPI0020B6BDC1|nr:hypothetical protein [Allokutzneria sp. A3M-2-11 16]MCP3804970.1 hypothetical protein [Allokutzneria sp. A3M-2-11 16]